MTLLREYSQGVGEMTWVLPTGAYDPRRHGTPLAAGQAELSEEARQPACRTLTSQTAHAWPICMTSAAAQSWHTCRTLPSTATCARSMQLTQESATMSNGPSLQSACSLTMRARSMAPAVQEHRYLRNPRPEVVLSCRHGWRAASG